jgi:hypothetical protein
MKINNYLLFSYRRIHSYFTVMQNLKTILHKLDTKIYSLVEGVINNPFDIDEIVREANAIQNRINQYKKYKKWMIYSAIFLIGIFLFALCFGKGFLEQIEFHDLLWLSVMLLLTYPFHYIFNTQVERLQTALYLKKIKAHLEEIIQEPVLQANNSKDTPDTASNFFELHTD